MVRESTVSHRFFDSGSRTLSAASLIKYCYLAYLSRPAEDRELYRAVRRIRPKSVVELGVGLGQRAVRLIEVACRYQRQSVVRYTGMDPFEGRPDSQARLTLKSAHKLLKPLGVQVQLVPGDPASALARHANALRDTDLLVIAADEYASMDEGAWFYVPRMLHAKSQVLAAHRDAKTGVVQYRQIEQSAIIELARAGTRRTRRAA
jgi:hypothetical protein